MTNLLPRLLYDVYDHLNWVRLTLLLAILFTSLVASILQSPPIIFMAALLLGAPLMSVAVGSFVSRGLKVTRSVPTAGTVGDVIRGEVAVASGLLWPAFLVQVRSGETGARSGATGARSGATNARAKARLEPHQTRAHQTRARQTRTRQTRPDGLNGESRAAAAGLTLPPYARAGQDTIPILALGGEEHMAPLVRSGARMVWSQHWLLQRRGIHELPPAQAGAVDPLGLNSQLPARTRPDVITVLPRPVKIGRLFCFGVSSAGLQSPRHAASVTNALDFHSVREWQPGEAIRRVHWKHTARTGKLHVVEWEEDAAADVAMLLDTHSANVVGTTLDNTLETAITIAASVAAYLLENGYQFQLFYWHQAPAAKTVAAAGAHSMPPSAQLTPPPAELRRVDARNAKHLNVVLQELAAIELVTEPSATLASIAHAALPLIPAGRSVLVVGPNGAEVKAALRLLAPLQHTGAACHAIVLDAASFGAAEWAAPPDVPDGNYRLVRRGESLAAALEQP